MSPCDRRVGYAVPCFHGDLRVLGLFGDAIELRPDLSSLFISNRNSFACVAYGVALVVELALGVGSVVEPFGVVFLVAMYGFYRTARQVQAPFHRASVPQQEF